MKRLGAVVVALALVGGAYFLSVALWGDEDSASGSEERPEQNDGEPLRVVCATEFDEACAELAADPDLAGQATFTTESPGDTAEALAADPDPAFDLWLTSTPWPDLVGVRSAVPPRIGAPSAPLAQAQLRLAARDQQASVIGGFCEPSGSSIACPLETVGGTFGAIQNDDDPTRITLGSAPTTETAGVLAVAALAATGTTIPLDVIDVQVDDKLQATFYRVKSASVLDPTPLRTLLLQPKFTIAADINVDRQLEEAANGDRLQGMNRGPLARAVAVPAETDRGREALETLGRDRVAAAIRDAGWFAPTTVDDAVPDPAVLDYLIDEWSQR